MRKRIIVSTSTAILLLVACMALAGCGEKSAYEGLNLDDYIKVGEYKGLTASPYEVKVSDEDVQERIDQALKTAGTQKDLEKGDEIKKGDTVNIDYSGKIDGKEFEGGTSEGYDLEIGSGSFIDGFEDGLIGKKIGDKTSLDLKFPDDYQSEEVAGKDVTFDVTINSGKRPQNPEYNDAFVKNNTEYDNTKEYEASLKETIKKEQKEQGENQQKSELWNQIMESTEVTKYPEEQVKKYVDGYSTQIDNMAEQYGMKKSDIMAQYGASDEKSFNKMLKEQAQSQVKQDMATAYIAEKEGIEYTEEDETRMVEEIEAQGYDEDKILEQTGMTMDELVHINLLREKVMDFILKNAKIKK